MDKKKFNEIMMNKFGKNNLSLSPKETELFYEYMKNLLYWNTKINLTAIREEEDIIVKHFLDSSIINKYINKGSVIDIGSGAGFPGIPIKILNDNIKVKLIDSVGKKVRFLDNTIEKLDLKNISAEHGRAEEFAHEEEYRENYDFVVSRAVANMSTLVEYMIPFAKVGGKCICMKGPSIEEELAEATSAIKKLGGEIEDIIKYNIEENERNLIIITKKKNTEQTYPRKLGKPLKEPLK